jgi:hypothetical protein
MAVVRRHAHSIFARSQSRLCEQSRIILQDKVRQLCIYVYSLLLNYTVEKKSPFYRKLILEEIRSWLSSTASPPNTHRRYHPWQNLTNQS